MKKPSAEQKQELLQYIPYLHGSVADDAFEAACYYEYARLSEKLKDAAALHKELLPIQRKEAKKRGKQLHSKGDTSAVIALQLGYEAVSDLRAFCVVTTASFPQKSWNALSSDERAQMMPVFYSSDSRAAALHMHEAFALEAMGVLDRFKAAAAKSGVEIKAGKRQRRPEYAIDVLESGLAYVVLTIDLRKSQKQLKREFENWLTQPAIKKLHRYKKGNPSLFKDRLKDLAATKLYRELGPSRANDFADEYRKDGLPFHDPRRGQSDPVALNEAPLFVDPGGFGAAEKRCKKFLSELITCDRCTHLPSDFAREVTKQVERLGIFDKSPRPVARKISKSVLVERVS